MRFGLFRKRCFSSFMDALGGNDSSCRFRLCVKWNEV